MCDINHPRYNCSGDSNIYKFNLRDGYPKLKTEAKKCHLKLKVWLKPKLRDLLKNIFRPSIHTR